MKRRKDSREMLILYVAFDRLEMRSLPLAVGLNRFLIVFVVRTFFPFALERERRTNG